MGTQQEVLVKFTGELEGLLDKIYQYHLGDAGSTFISSYRLNLVYNYSREIREELHRCMQKGTGKRYLELAPEFRKEIMANVALVEEAITEWVNEVRRVALCPIPLNSGMSSSGLIYLHPSRRRINKNSQYIEPYSSEPDKDIFPWILWPI